MEEKTRLWPAPYDAGLREAPWESEGGGLLSLFLGRLLNFLLISGQLSHGGRGERCRAARRRLGSGGSSLSNPSAALLPLPPF